MAIQASPFRILSGSGDFWTRAASAEQCLSLYHCGVDTDTLLAKSQTGGSYFTNRALFYVRIEQNSHGLRVDFVTVGHRFITQLWDKQDIKARTFVSRLHGSCVVIARVALRGWRFRIDLLEAELELVCSLCLLKVLTMRNATIFQRSITDCAQAEQF
jgi:hypothetical protein